MTVNKKIVASGVVVIGLASSISATVISQATDLFTNNKIHLVDTKRNSIANTDDLQPFEQFNESPILTQKTGPIISWGSEIKSLDWFGATRWKIDLLDDKNKNLFPQEKNTDLVQYRNRAFISWDLDVTNNILWLLMNTSKQTATPARPNYSNIHASKVVKINSLNGDIEKVYEWTEGNKPKTFVNYWALYYQITALRDGNVLLFSQVDRNKRKSVVLDTKKETFTEHSEDGTSVDNVVIKGRKTAREVRNVFLVPIANNLNILAVLDFNSHSNRSNSTATGDVYLLLVDDKLAIHKTEDTKWKNFIHIKNVFPDWKTRSVDPVINRSIYRTFENKVYFTIYNKFFVVDTNTNAQGGLDFAEYDLANSGNNTAANSNIPRPTKSTDKVNAISSFAIDANENVYYKLINDSVIYNLKISVDKTDVKKTTFASTTYYDISKHQDDEVKKNANTFVLFNVTGSTGALFALNAKVINNGEDLNKNLTGDKDKNYGLALAIAPSASNPNTGDVLGLLNTNKKFIKPADFSIEKRTLEQKLPSEITRNDLVLENGGFFTSNTSTENGKLKYLPFEIKDINDEQGTFKVVAHLDQIPWFSNTLPADFVPRKIEHEFKDGQKITSKISWIKQENINYDFKNTLPSKVSESDLNSFDLFQANFASQTITQGKNVLYPSKKYSVESNDDSTGKITVKVEYKYVPLGVNYTSISDVKTYTSTQEYTVFKSSDTPSLKFAGQIGEAYSNPIDIKNTPVLKSFLQSSVLASSIEGLIKSNQIKYTDFLNLVESKGYPTNKMQFSLKADDTLGTLVFNANLPNDYYSNKQINGKPVQTTFTQTFSGFNKSNEYSFNFKNALDNISINKVFAKSYLPSFITQANILSDFVTFKGFDAKDFNVVLTPNDTEGKLNIRVELNKAYSASIGTNTSLGFNNYVVQKTYEGFLKQAEFNDQFNVEFIENNSELLSKLKEKTLLEIDTTFKEKKELEIGGVKYTNLNDLVQKLLVKSKGKQIPQSDWSNNNNIITSITYDNNAGTAAVFLTIKKTANSIIPTDLNFVISYNDFARGNKTPTQDNLSFVSNAAFNRLMHQDKKLNLFNLYDYLSVNNNINTLFSNLTGEYKTLIQSGDFELSVFGNELFNTARIEITFNKLKNPSSLKTYSNTFIFDN